MREAPKGRSTFKVVISLLEPNNVCVHLVGRSGVVRAPSKTHPLIHIAQIDIIDIIFVISIWKKREIHRNYEVL